MKEVLCLAVILITVLNLALVKSEIDWKPYEKCGSDCNGDWIFRKDPIHKHVRVCVESGLTYLNHCFYNCAKLHPKLNLTDINQVDCKPGSIEYCWNEECTEEEKMVISEQEKLWCTKEPPHQFVNQACKAKCWTKFHEKREMELVLCKDLFEE